MSLASLKSLDVQFGRYHAPKDENRALFMSALLASSRLGHLCLEIVGEKVTPSFGAQLDQRISKGAFSEEGKAIGVGHRWYLPRNYACEISFYQHWKRLEAEKIEPVSVTCFEGMSCEQALALEHALNHPLTVISGGPGTGKTFTAAKILEAFLSYKQGHIALAAPTGKAAAHLKEVLGSTNPRIETYTLHSLLRVSHFSQYRLIVVDESSMIDALLMERLFSKVPSGTHLIMLGDVDQLPPVDSGHFFRALCCSKSCLKLTTGFRAEKSELVEIAESIKKGDLVPYIELPSQRDLLQQMLAVLPSQKHYDKEIAKAFEKLRFLSAVRKGPYGVDTLNRLIYEQREREGIKCHPIIIKENASAKGFVNGDVGMLEEERVWMSGGEEYCIWEIPPYEFAYVLTIHKSQGSEYDTVWIILPPGSEEFGKELVYTGVTRAKKESLLLTTQEVLKQTLQTQTVRLSGI